MKTKLFFIVSACILLMIFVSGCPQSSTPSTETETAQVAPKAPVAPSKDVVSDTSISITWTKADDATSYVVYYHTASTPEAEVVKNATADSTTRHKITGLTAGTEYFIWLKANNSAGDSAFSAPVLKVTTKETPASKPEAPTALTASIVGSDTMRITWTAPTGGADSYDVYLDRSTTAHNTNPVTATTYDFALTALLSTHNIKIKAKKGSFVSDFSEVLTITPTKTFNALGIKTSGPDENITVDAHLTKSTAQLEIYLQNGASMTPEDIDYIATNFAEDYPTLTDIYGTHSDVDNNEKKIIILLYDMNEDPTGPSGYVAGYFWPGDLIMANPNDGTALSNEAEILYVESEVSGEIEGIYDTVIHEFQHLINYNMNVIASNGQKQSDLWLNEALAESTAIVKSEGKIPYNRVAIYNDFSNNPADTAPFHNSILTGNYFYYWNDDQYVLADYATASLFMYWLYLNGEGNATFKDIAKASLANRGGYKAVLEAVGKTTALGTLISWESVLFAWLEANENESVGYPDGIVVDSAGNTGPIAEIGLRTKAHNGEANQGVALTARLYSGSALLTTYGGFPDDERIAKDTFTSTDYWVDANGDPLTINIMLNKSTLIDDYYLSMDLPVASNRNTVRNATRRNNFPVLVDDRYRIIPRSQTLLPEGAFE